MKLEEIKDCIDSSDPQDRMRAITELRHYEPELAVPLLKKRVQDQELIIRSFAIMGLGVKRTDEAFELLLNIIQQDDDPNIRAEAANSLGSYGARAIPHLVELFRNESHWLVRQSIYAVINLSQHPDLLLELAIIGLQSNDLVVKQVSVSNLAQLADTPEAAKALELLLPAAKSKQTEVRIQAARALAQFDNSQARAALEELRDDADHRVIGATLEKLL
ncbi:MAG: HEAT repeat domain-containing protein [Cyanobacteria bacterium P01_F01_bin.3]